MPMSYLFKRRLFPIIPELMEKFRPPLFGDSENIRDSALSPGFHIYDESGIRKTIARMQNLFFSSHPGTNFFAVKACPNIQILKIILDAGFGLDCASPSEIYRAKLAGAGEGQIMYTSNNTNPAFYGYAIENGAIINLDDLSFIKKLPVMPETICFRYNPGPHRQEGSNEIIGTPINQKYGLRYDQIIEAYKQARDRGAKIFGLHTMYASNCLDPRILAGNVRMQLKVVDIVQSGLGIEFDFINIGGGIGINYRPDQEPVDIALMADLIDEEMAGFKSRHGYLPKLYLESGRYVTGPHGVLVGKVINIMDKYKKFVGVDFCDAADILRAPLYPAYHEVSIINPKGREVVEKDDLETVSIVGPLCENMHMVSDRSLPVILEGDYIVVHDTGAHGIAMSSKYNGWGASQELLLKPDGSVRRISRAETVGDLLAREIGFFNER